MRSETTNLMERFPVRKSKAQKAAFRDWTAETLRAAGYGPVVEKGRGPSYNLVAGDPDSARVVFTAHYDTPARLPYPNIIFPHNMLLTLLAQMPLVIGIFLIAAVADALVLLLTDSFLASLLTVYVIVFGMLILMLAGPANPSNVNDNTSGVVTVLEIALSLPPEEREGAAFILFDNEEMGLLGSSALYKRHKKAMKDTLLINFDCVSDGDHIRFYPNKKVKKRAEVLAMLEACFPSAGEKAVTVTRGGYYPSDQKHFPMGVGVAALCKGAFGYRLRRIHTKRDTIFEEENIELLRRGALELVRETRKSEAEEAAANEL